MLWGSSNQIIEAHFTGGLRNPIKPVKIVDLVNYWYFERGVTPANKGICFERHRA